MKPEKVTKTRFLHDWEPFALLLFHLNLNFLKPLYKVVATSRPASCKKYGAKMCSKLSDYMYYNQQ